jgi:hypothetical protein
MSDKFDTTNIPENKKTIVKDSELLQYLNRLIKDKAEVRKLNYKMLNRSLLLLGITGLPAIFGIAILSYLGLDIAPLWDVLKYYYGAIGVYGIGLIGLSRGSSE